MRRSPGRTHNLQLQAYGGAVNRIAPQATAFPHRGSLFSMQYLTRWSDPADEKQGLDWTRHFYDEMRPYVSGSAYSNMCDLDLIDWEHAYYGELRAPRPGQVAIRPRQRLSLCAEHPNGLSDEPTAIPAPPFSLTLFAALLLVAMLLAGAVLLSRSRSLSSGAQAHALVLRERSKTAGCVVSAALPDPDCTPGAVFAAVGANEDLPGGATVPSARDVSNDTKRRVYTEYGSSSRGRGLLRGRPLDRPGAGGSNDIANLWPEWAEPRPGFHEKDRFEDYLHDRVCSGRMDLIEAQREIAENWLWYWEQAGRP